MTYSIYLLGYILSCGRNYIVDKSNTETRVYLSKLNEVMLDMLKSDSDVSIL